MKKYEKIAQKSMQKLLNDKNGMKNYKTELVELVVKRSSELI